MAFLDNNSFNLERQLALTEAKFEILTARLETLQKNWEKNDNSTDDIGKEIDYLKLKISDLEAGIQLIKDELASLNSNVFLQFTKEIDLKKLITILLITSTAISSPTLVTSWFEVSPGEDSEKLEQLIDLLENSANN